MESITYAAVPTFDERVTTQATVGILSLGMLEVTDHVKETVSVPHCNDHSGGAQLSPAGIAFRSFQYHQQFVVMNRAVVG